MFCKLCKKEIQRTDRRALFCSKSCAASFNNAAAPKRKKVIRNCYFCEQVITGDGKKYCSQQCCANATIEKNNASIQRTGVAPTHWSGKRFLLGFSSSCSVCHNDTWMGDKIPLVLDHINGDASDNSINNLRLICCNYDAQTDTYKSKNKGKGRYYRRLRYAQGKSY